MLSGFKNSKKQGDAGMGIAIGWFAENGYSVLIPLTDSQEYDLAIDNGIKIEKVQVKTSFYKAASGGFIVELRTKGGNKTGTGKTKYWNPKNSDWLFTALGNGSKYLIPSNFITAKNSIVIGEKYKQFKLS